MKTTLAFCLLLIAFISMNAQNYNTYDISKYYTPDIKRNKLDLNLSGHGGYTNDEFYSSKSNNYDGSIQAGLNHFTHTRKRYSELGGGIYIGGSGYNDESKRTTTSKRSYFHPKFSLFTKQRFYNPFNHFISLGGETILKRSKNYNFYERMTPPEELNESTEKTYGYSLNLRIGAGKGRLESVEDARQAIYILNNLSKKGVLTRELTEKETFTLSQLISSVKNKRFFDSRLHLIDEITSVDSFFVKNNLLETSNASYFTTLYDYWLHGALFERLSGKEFHSYISADMMHKGYDIYKDAEKVVHNKNNNTYFYWTNQFSYEKPVNLYWQNSILTSLTIGLQRDKTLSEPIDEEKAMQYSLSGRYEWSYYPNSRTRFSAGIRQELGYTRMISFEGEKSFENGAKYFKSNTSIGGGMYYYISPQLRLSASISTLFNYQKGKVSQYNEKTDYLRTELLGNISFTYSIY